MTTTLFIKDGKEVCRLVTAVFTDCDTKQLLKIMDRLREELPQEPPLVIVIGSVKEN